MQNIFFDCSSINLNKDFSQLEMIAKDNMQKIISGYKVNADEDRMVGHYWLRNSLLAPTKEIKKEIDACIKQVKSFVRKSKFRYVVICGIGGSSLGSEFIYNALANNNDKTKLYFLDNTDPEGMEKVFSVIRSDLDETLVIVISKSGSTIETRNAMINCQALFKRNKIEFNNHAVCITQKDSQLYNIAVAEQWLEIFPIWDFICGRTSVMSAVGLLPLGLAKINIDDFLKGARDFDNDDKLALKMAKCWYSETNGIGGKTMVILPYKDSLSMLGKYLQQLIMESLGKEKDNDGNIVFQGLTVFGNKGTSDQHSFCQQLIASNDNIFVTFIEVLKDSAKRDILVDRVNTSGDYLNAFMLGTKKVLESHGKHTMTISIPEVNEYYLGALIAMFERTVSYYAAMININAYNQPAVEYGKNSAKELIELKNKAIYYLKKDVLPKTASEIASVLNANIQDVYNLLLHQSFNGKIIRFVDESNGETKFGLND